MSKHKSMTEGQWEHVNDIAKDFSHRVRAKYKRGVEEHGGDIRDLGSLGLIEEAMQEAVDQFVYLSVLKDKLTKESHITQLPIPVVQSVDTALAKDQFVIDE